MATSFSDRRKRILETRLEQLYEEYEIVQKQLGRTLNDADSLRLKRQAEQLDQSIEELEEKIGKLSRDEALLNPVESVESSAEAEEQLELIVRLREVLSKHFSMEELRTLCFDLGVDYDALSGEEKTGKTRELVAYLERRNRIVELIEVGNKSRPDINWDELNLQ